MKIVLFGATGTAGRRIAHEALNRGHQVAGVIRDADRVTSPDSRMRLVKGDATKPQSVARVVEGADVVISAISPRPTPRGLPGSSLCDAARALIAGLQEARVKRLLVVGGAASLFVQPGMQLIDTPTFEPEWRPEANEHSDALRIYQAEGANLDWTFFCPAARIYPGDRTGSFRLGGDNLITDGNGRSEISFEDYAMALIDEIEQPRHSQRRFTIAY